MNWIRHHEFDMGYGYTLDTASGDVEVEAWDGVELQMWYE